MYVNVYILFCYKKIFILKIHSDDFLESYDENYIYPKFLNEYNLLYAIKKAHEKVFLYTYSSWTNLLYYI